MAPGPRCWATSSTTVAGVAYVAYRLRFEGQLPLPAHYAHRYEAATIILVVLLFSVMARARVRNLDRAVVPESKLSIRTLVELIVETFYDMMKEMMGGKRAKRYLPLIGTAAMFIFFSNMASLIPGFTPPPAIQVE